MGCNRTVQVRIVVSLMRASLFCGAVLAACQAGAITISQVDVFHQNDYQNWEGAAAGVLPDSGPAGAGDFALSVETTGFPVGAGSRLVTINGGESSPAVTQWTGDWTAAGVWRLSFDVRNDNAFDLNLWLGIAGPNGPGVAGHDDAYVSKSSAVVPADGLWHSVAFNVLSTDFDAWGTGSDPAAALANVFQLRILHSPNQDWRGATGSASMLIDNVRAIPEPSAFVLVAVSGAVLVLMDTRRRASLIHEICSADDVGRCPSRFTISS